MTDKHPDKRRPVLRWAALLCFILGGGALGLWQMMVHPDTPLSQEWNPTQPLTVGDPVTPLTGWKLRQALDTDETCLAALATGAQAERLSDLEQSAQCGIAPQVRLGTVGGASLSPVNTRCQTALRLAMWVQHGVQPAAQEILGQDIAQVLHFSSFSCRAIRTPSGSSGRMSMHATADAIDISGFILADGTRLTLTTDWGSAGATAQFLRRVNDTACNWFPVTLGPAYNALHADHFHLQNTGFGLCR